MKALSHPEQDLQAPFSPVAAITQGEAPASPDDLSNDYLNHYSEALMLIELAADDPGMVDVLSEWQPVDYPTYFSQSQLRRAPRALAAYRVLGADARHAFEEVTRAMDRLALTAIRALRPPCLCDEARGIAEATAPALRGLIARAAAFLNSGGRDIDGHGEVEEAQAVIDRLIARQGGE